MRNGKKPYRTPTSIINFLYYLFSFWLQGIPSCPVSLDVLRSHLPNLGCWILSPDKEGGGTEDTPAAANNNNHIIIGDLGSGGNQKDHFGQNLTPLHRFYKQQQQRKMPGFRGRRGLCGCFQVSCNFLKEHLWFHDGAKIFVLIEFCQLRDSALELIEINYIRWSEFGLRRPTDCSVLTPYRISMRFKIGCVDIFHTCVFRHKIVIICTSFVWYVDVRTSGWYMLFCYSGNGSSDVTLSIVLKDILLGESNFISYS